MTKIVQLHRMTSSLAAIYTGPQGEIIFDIGGNLLRCQDGATPGGFPTLSSNNPTATGLLTVPQISLNSQQGIIGTIAGDNANAGSIGELISNNIVSPGVNALSTVVTDVGFIDVTPGDWEVTANAVINPGGGGTLTGLIAWTSDISATYPASANNGGIIQLIQNFTVTVQILPIGSQRFNVSQNTRIYMSCLITYSGALTTVYGFLKARRVR